ncbi:MAG TPA: GtrA family protein [Sphingobium sp.]|nr:GtrA family protein [Sphingobium sp.]
MGQRPQALAALTGAIVARFTFIRYLLASICALSSDMLLFLALIRLDLHPAAAAFAGYMAGLLVHWLISTRFVFLSAGRATHVQRAGFVASAVIGMGITLAIVSGLTGAGLAPTIGKLVAIPVSFLTVYAIRKYGVFASI